MELKALKSLLVVASCCLTVAATAQTFYPTSSVRDASRPNTVHTDYGILQGRFFHPHVMGTVLTRQGGVIQGYYPSDIRTAYSLPSTGGSGAIAIIEAYDLPTNLSDFNTFSAQFNLPTETSGSKTASTNKVLQVIYASGSEPVSNPNWGGEIALDIEWAHAIAPNAKIYLIECATDDFTNILAGVQIASTLPDVHEVSMSFGTSETSNESTYDSNFTAANQVYFAAAGDTSNELDYPAASPNVVSVGGTSLNLLTNGQLVSETAWADGGGGPSQYEPLPAFQIGFTTGARGIPDLAADADPNTGCAVYDSTPIPHEGSGWMVDGGTSLATPIAAGIVNLRGAFSASSYDELVRQYSLSSTSNFRKITSGTDGAYTARAPYNFITGLGVMIGLYPTAVYAPNSLVPTVGTPIAGLPDNVIVKDNHDYTVRSVLSTPSQQVVELTGSFAAPLGAGQTRTGASLSITGMTTAETTTLYLYNFTTQNWNSIETLPFTATSGTLSISIPDFSDYFDANGNVQFELYSLSQNLVATPAPFFLSLDQVQLGVATIN